MYVKQFSQLLTNVISEIAQYVAIYRLIHVARSSETF
jgi:hypothetical protein